MCGKEPTSFITASGSNALFLHVTECLSRKRARATLRRAGRPGLPDNGRNQVLPDQTVAVEGRPQPGARVSCHMTRQSHPRSDGAGPRTTQAGCREPQLPSLPSRPQAARVTIPPFGKVTPRITGPPALIPAVHKTAGPASAKPAFGGSK